MPDAPSPSPAGRVVHEVVWSDAFSWWILFKAAGMAFAPTVLALATFGSMATWAGFSLADAVGLPTVTAKLATNPSASVPCGSCGAAVTGQLPTPSRVALPMAFAWVEATPSPVAELLVLLSTPWNPLATTPAFLGSLARVVWFLLVWSIVATAITRHVALRLVDEELPGLLQAVRYGSQKWLASFNAAAFVFLGLAALSVPGALLGLLMRFDWGLAVAGAIWPLVLLGAVVLAILAVGLAAGWPLMVSAVGVERGDSFQAISTAFSYLYQRPIHFAFYSLISCGVAVLAFFAAALFADTTLTFALWATSFGMGHDRTADVIGAVVRGAADPRWGIQALQFWTDGLRAILAAFGWGYFWAIAPAIYLLLRQDVDATELDEIVLDEPPGDST
jgi:hypothetical protein